MEKWQLAGIFSAEPRLKLDLTTIARLRNSGHSQGDSPRKATLLAELLKKTCRKLADVVALL